MFIAIVGQMVVTCLAACVMILSAIRRGQTRISCYKDFSIIVTIFSLFYLVEICSPGAQAALMANRLQFAMMPFVGAFYYLSMQEIPNKHWNGALWRAALTVVPILGALWLIAGDRLLSMDGLYSQYSVEAAPFTHVNLSAGPLALIGYVYAGALIALGAITVRPLLKKSNQTIAKRVVILLIMGLPLAALFVWISRVRVGSFDLTSAFLTATSLVAGLSQMHLGAERYLPIAHERLYEHVGDAALLLDAHDRFLEANAQAKKLFSTLETTQPGTLLNNIHGMPSKLPREDGELSVLALDSTKDARTLRAQCHSVLRRGALVCRWIVLRDVTEEGRVSQAVETLSKAVAKGSLGERINLKLEHAECRATVESMHAMLDSVCLQYDALPVCVAFLGEGWEIRHVNRSMLLFCKRNGINPYGSMLVSRLVEAGGDAMANFPGESMATHYSLEITISDDAGQERDYALNLQRLPVREGCEPSYLLLLNDITSLTMAKNDAEQASRAKGYFLSRMSHEIRTPMNAIVGMTQIGKSTQDVDRLHNCLMRIEENSNILLEISNDILDHSMVEANMLVLSEGLFSLIEDIDAVVSSFNARITEKNITLRTSVTNLAHDGIIADAQRLNQALINTLACAVQYAEPGAAVELVVTEEGARIDGYSVYRFLVRASGTNMMKIRDEKIFDPYENEGASGVRRYGGTWLGLAISKKIVEMMGGAFSLSNQQNEDAVISFTIRVKSQQSAGAKEDALVGLQDALPGFTGKRILIVDDIEINRVIILELLEDTGVEMETAENGKIALNKFKYSPDGYYDLILMDMQMPVMDGCEATERIRASHRSDSQSVKIIAMTANVLKEDIKKALDSGMDGHLGKPIDMDEMLDVLSKMLE